MALAKGGLVAQHVLIVPVTHYPSLAYAPLDVAAEIETYLHALRLCYDEQVNVTHRSMLIAVVLVSIGDGTFA